MHCHPAGLLLLVGILQGSSAPATQRFTIAVPTSTLMSIISSSTTSPTHMHRISAFGVADKPEMPQGKPRKQLP
ncbi:hypothetical protein F4825DRAFT_440856 [Nemania diffusa]|nr:hypothetical protein F4825DRAFT_440856 [Nemania diffusa]